jgi:hypothetical protein
MAGTADGGGDPDDSGEEPAARGLVPGGWHRGHRRRPNQGGGGTGAWFMHQPGAMGSLLLAETGRAQEPSCLTSLGCDTPSVI